MRIEDLLEAKRKDIIEKWFNRVIETYPNDTAHFLKSQKDPFDNPVGSNIHSGLVGLVNGLIGKSDEDSIRDFLDPIVRIRAIQTMFSPSQAVEFIFNLKDIIRDILKKDLQDKEVLKDLCRFEKKIDRLGMTAFDLFVSCRERIYDIKANQERSKVYRAFDRAGLLREIQED